MNASVGALGGLASPALGQQFWQRPSIGPQPQFGFGPYLPQQTAQYGGLPYRNDEYQGVEFTINDMRRMVRDALLREQQAPMRKLCEEITAQVNGKDYLSEVAALYYYVLKNVRYMRDPIHVEYVQHPLVLLQPEAADRAAGRRGRQDDCEAQATALAALCMCIGSPCEFVTVSTKMGAPYHHVFTVCHVQGIKVCLDPIPGAHVGRMLQSVKRHQVWPIEPIRFPDSANGWGVANDVSPEESALGWTVADAPAVEADGPPLGEFHALPGSF